MREAVKDIKKNRKKKAIGKCPYQLISFSEGVFCFDPWLADYVKPPEIFIHKWCWSDFRSCPNFLAYQGKLRTGAHKHFML